MERQSQSSRMALRDDLMAGYVHARPVQERDEADRSPRVVKRRLHTKTSLADIERGRARVPELPRLGALHPEPEEVPVSQTSIAASVSPRSGSARVHPYNPVGQAIGSSSFE